MNKLVEYWIRFKMTPRSTSWRLRFNSNDNFQLKPTCSSMILFRVNRMLTNSHNSRRSWRSYTVKPSWRCWNTNSRVSSTYPNKSNRWFSRCRNDSNWRVPLRSTLYPIKPNKRSISWVRRCLKQTQITFHCFRFTFLEQSNHPTRIVCMYLLITLYR